MESLIKLRDAYAKLDWAKDDIQRGAYQGLDSLIELIKSELNEFMVDNEPSPGKNEFNIWDWVADDNLRPVLEGIFHDKEQKMAVATNGHILVADAASYDKSKVCTSTEWDGRMSMNKYGKFIEGRYPNWLSVVPKDSEEFVCYEVPLAEIDKYIKKYNAYIKLNGFTRKNAPRLLYKVGETYFNAWCLRTFLTATDGQIKISKESALKPGIYWAEKRIALIMPLIADSLDKEGLENGLYLSKTI